MQKTGFFKFAPKRWSTVLFPKKLCSPALLRIQRILCWTSPTRNAFLPSLGFELGTIYSEWERVDALTHSATVHVSKCLLRRRPFDGGWGGGWGAFENCPMEMLMNSKSLNHKYKNRSSIQIAAGNLPIRPNPDGRKYAKPDGRKSDETAEKM